MESEDVGQQEDTQCCLQCERIQVLSAFARRKGKVDAHKHICSACEQVNQEKRHQRVMAQRVMWQQEEREQKRQSEWARRVMFRQVQIERRQALERWYLQQPDRRCPMCHQLKPATAFQRSSPEKHRTLCATCSEIDQQRYQLACCLCLQKMPRRDFLAYLYGYALRGYGTSLALCCRECEVAFLALSEPRQWIHIDASCQRAFPVGQIIYAETDPDTGAIRYIGRTSKPERRHAQHLTSASSKAGRWGSDNRAWFTRRNWIQALAENGQKPTMRILYPVAISPLVIEWELRYILHGIQQGWPLLNSETMDKELVNRICVSSLHFLEAPFEKLLQHHFFSRYGLAAFLHKWYAS